MYTDTTGHAVANVAGGVVSGISGALLGKLIADALGLSSSQYWALVGAATVAGSALGVVIGPYIAKLSSSAIATINAKIVAASTSGALLVKNLVDHGKELANKIIDINKIYSTGNDIYNSITSIISSASYYNNKYDQVASIIRGIAQHAFIDGNKRTAVDSLFMLMDEMGLKYNINFDQAWKLVNDIATGVINNVSDISKILQQ